MVNKRRTEFVAFCLLLILAGLGAALRLVKLDDKEFWNDECFTALVLSGRTTSQLKEKISVRPVAMSELTKFHVINESSNVANLIHVIGEDEPGHAPCFYLFEYILCALFGSTPYTMRLAAVIISIATLPLIFWLANETYKDRTLAALATATASLSPCLIYYAQEARDYSLGIMFMTISTATLFYALRTPKRWIWLCYFLSLVAGLYSWLFITIVIGGHIVYVALSQGRRTEIWRPFLLSLAATGLLFAPWMLFLSQHTSNFRKAYDWIQPSLSQTELLMVWSAIPYKSFALFGFKTAKLGPLLLLVTAIETAAAVLATIPLRNRKYMYLSIIGVWLIVFPGQDLISGGARSAVFRYQTIVIFSILMLFPTLIEWLWKRNRVAKSAALMTIALLFGAELLSDSYMLNCKIWPDKAIKMRFTQPIAQRLNKEPTAAIVAEEQSINLTELLDLSYIVHPDCQLIFRDVKAPQPIPKNIETLYLWNPSSELENQLQSRYEITDNVDNFPYLKRAHLKANLE